VSDLLDARGWPGVSCGYAVTPRGGGAGLDIGFTFDPAVVPDPPSAPGEADKSRELYNRYRLVCKQFGEFDESCRLTAPSVTAAIDTAATLAAAPIEQTDSGAPIAAMVGGFLCQVRNWIAARREGRIEPVPQMTMGLAIDRGYPVQWSGDLQELAVGLTLTRTLDAVKPHASTLRRSVTTRVDARQSPASDGDPSGLSAFAEAFEEAYGAYDGGSGRLKIAAGRSTVWAMRWGGERGAAVTIRNDDRHPEIFYAPPPLSPRSFTRRVDGLRRYRDAANATFSGYEEVSQTFSGVDLDRWAEAFLQSVDAVESDALAAAKTSLAGAIAGTIDFVYDRGAGDRSSALDTLRRMLLDSLSGYNSLSVLAQLPVTVRLHETIEPGGDRSSPSHITGWIDSGGATAWSSAGAVRLPLRQGGAWLNVPVAASDPAATRAIDLSPSYEMASVERAIQPSPPLTFVRPRDSETPPDGNTLTVPVGRMRVPIPLRAFPSVPVLREASAMPDTPAEPISSVGQALVWRYAMVMPRPQAAQDTLVVEVVFNEPLANGALAREAVPASEARPGPADLFDALARYTFEYPQLLPSLATNGGGDASPGGTLARYVDLVAGVAGTWAAWEPPQSSDRSPASDGAPRTWTYAIDQDDESRTLRVTALGPGASSTGANGTPPWPDIQGYALQSQGSGDRAIYALSAAAAPADLAISWGRLFVLDYQSARGQAWIERNRNLAPPGQLTNPRFVCRSSVGSFPAKAPLIDASSPVPAASRASLDAALHQLLLDLRTAPAGSPSGAGGGALRIACALSYSFTLPSPGGSDMRASLPVSLVRTTIDPGQEGVLAADIARGVSQWKSLTNPSLDGGRLTLDLTLFATSIVPDGRDLPLARLSEVVIVAPTDPAWWTIED
jgi:hypothetical protein